MLELKNLTIHRGNSLICENVNISLEKGSCLIIRGKNGSGKSTLFSTFLGHHLPTKGQVFIDGHNLSRLGRKEQQEFFQKTGIVTQQPHLRPLDTVRKAIGHSAADHLQRERMLNFIGLETKANTMIKDLSFSEQRRVDLARSLVHQPLLIIWDEPFLGLDDFWRGQFLQALRELHDLGTTMVFCTLRAQDFSDILPQRAIQL